MRSRTFQLLSAPINNVSPQRLEQLLTECYLTCQQSQQDFKLRILNILNIPTSLCPNRIAEETEEESRDAQLSGFPTDGDAEGDKSNDRGEDECPYR